jgi:hypothetical protein
VATNVLTDAARTETDAYDQVGHRERTVAWRLLIAVALLYVTAQLVVLPIGRPPLWDESVYLSQVTPGSNAIIFLASRARGITVLIAPVTLLGGSFTAVRVFLLLASATATAVAFRVWIPLIGLAAPVGAITYCFSWLALLNGADIFPNVWSAILGLATTGLIARRVEGANPRGAVLAFLTIAAMALIRPTDAVVLAVAIAVWILALRRSSWRLPAALGVGVVVGWAPWLIEMSIRFGGPVRAFQEAAIAGNVEAGSGFVTNVLVHLAATDGRPAGDGASVAGIAWWAALGALVAFAVVRTPRPGRGVSILATIAALALAGEYLAFVSGTAPRFLLPTYALASIPAGVAIVALFRGQGIPRPAGRVIAALVLLVLLPWAIWQGMVADRYLSKRLQSTAAFASVGDTLRRLANGRPCSFQSPHGWPTTQFISGCVGADLVRPGGPTADELDELRAGGHPVFVIMKRTPPRWSPLRTRTPITVEGPYRPWLVYAVR